MTPEQFAYWLQGFVEIRDSRPTTREWDVIKHHLSTIFNKVTPNKYPHPIRPEIAEPYRGDPATPWPIGPYVTPPNPWTTPNYAKPEVICSVAPGAGTNWSSGAGDVSFSGGAGFSGIKIGDLK